MVSARFCLLFLAGIYFLDETAAVTCDVAPSDPACINCAAYPTHLECLTRYLAVSSTTASPLTVATTRRSRIRRIRSYFGNLLNQFRNKRWF
ncbi:hypothetical protein KR018_002226 [Drosophila ironensis]|nr:hypothetical protein KR018_002226 [Drosophila ironensis]